MRAPSLLKGSSRSYLVRALAHSRQALIAVAVLSGLLNILLLAGPIYLLLIYDSVMPSGSVPTLMALLLIVAIAYIFQAVFDGLRSRILGNVAALFDCEVTGHVQDLVATSRLRGERDAGDGMTPVRDLDSIRSFLAGPGPGALLDLPWILLFLSFLTLLHVWLGVTAFVGALVLIGLTLFNDRVSREPIRRVSQAIAARSRTALDTQRQIELVHALGMRSRMKRRWEGVNTSFMAEQDLLARQTGLFGVGSKVFRLFLQSLVLTVGALLYLSGQASGGIVFAASILAARALAPVDQAIANWRGFTAGRQGWARLAERLPEDSVPDEMATELPPPEAELRVEGLAVSGPGMNRLILRNVHFVLEAGDALGLIGPSAAGKTSLVRTLVGIWPPLAGKVRLDGAALDQWDSDMLGAHLGYLPQQVDFFEGTIAQNIARLDPQASAEAIIAAARSAGVHEMILLLPQGYDTTLGADGTDLSAGQRQRIGLARALYGDPFLVVLDEPNSNLDADGEKALEETVERLRKRKAITVLVAHRPSALAKVNKVAVLKDGSMADFGPRGEVLDRLGIGKNATAAAAVPGRVKIVRAR